MKKTEWQQIYYINFGVPSIAYSIEIMEVYLDCGVTHFQLDLPTRHPNPEIENDYIMERMKTALAHCDDFMEYLEALRQLKKKHPNLDIEFTVYANTVEEIGVETFVDFCKEVGIHRVSLLTQTEKETRLLPIIRESGIQLLHPVFADASANELDDVLANDEPVILLLEGGSELQKEISLETITKTVQTIRKKGNLYPIYATMGIRSVERVKDLQGCELDGVYIGSVLMKLWDDKDALKKRIYDFESV